MRLSRRVWVAVLALLVVVLAGCGDGGTSDGSAVTRDDETGDLTLSGVVDPVLVAGDDFVVVMGARSSGTAIERSASVLRWVPGSGSDPEPLPSLPVEDPILSVSAVVHDDVIVAAVTGCGDPGPPDGDGSSYQRCGTVYGAVLSLDPSASAWRSRPVPDAVAQIAAPLPAESIVPDLDVVLGLDGDLYLRLVDVDREVSKAFEGSGTDGWAELPDPPLLSSLCPAASTLYATTVAAPEQEVTVGVDPPRTANVLELSGSAWVSVGTATDGIGAVLAHGCSDHGPVIVSDIDADTVGIADLLDASRSTQIDLPEPATITASTSTNGTTVVALTDASIISTPSTGGAVLTSLALDRTPTALAVSPDARSVALASGEPQVIGSDEPSQDATTVLSWRAAGLET